MPTMSMDTRENIPSDVCEAYGADKCGGGVVKWTK